MIGRTPRYAITALLLVATVVVFAGCGSEPDPAPTATPDIPATVSAAVALALGTPVTQPVDATPEPVLAPTAQPDAHREPAGTPDMEATINAAVATYALEENPESLEFWAIANDEEARIRLEQHPGVINAKDELGRTPLSIAVSRNENPEVTAILLDRRGSFPVTILHKAVYNSNPEVVALLLDVGADIMVEDLLVGWTPLHTAAWDCCNTSVIALLLERGAVVNAQDYLGRTPCQMALAPRLTGTLDCNRNAAENIALLCR